MSTRAEGPVRRLGRDPAREPVSLLRYQRVAAIVREQLAGGVLAPGAPAPSAAALARATGYSGVTCRRALRTLVADGILVPGASPGARPRVPGYAQESRDGAARALSASLAARRSAAGLTQPQLAELVAMSVTTVAHARGPDRGLSPDSVAGHTDRSAGGMRAPYPAAEPLRDELAGWCTAACPSPSPPGW